VKFPEISRPLLFAQRARAKSGRHRSSK
jgi:hypothetical protein